MEQEGSKGVVGIDAVELAKDEGAVVIIDQTKLPNSLEHIRLETPEQMYDAILHLKVRGAPAIGVCAGYCYYVCARQDSAGATSWADVREPLRAHKEYLNGSHPTAVNLSWALDRMEACAEAHASEPVADVLAALGRECRAIHEEDVRMSAAISPESSIASPNRTPVCASNQPVDEAPAFPGPRMTVPPPFSQSSSSACCSSGSAPTSYPSITSAANASSSRCVSLSISSSRGTATS